MSSDLSQQDALERQFGHDERYQPILTCNPCKCDLWLVGIKNGMYYNTQALYRCDVVCACT